MRWGVTVLAVVGGIGGLAIADPIAEETFLAQIWKGDAKQRASGATSLAERIASGHEHAIELGRSAVISNDPKVRVPLLEALIGQNVIERASAALVPTRAAAARAPVGCAAGSSSGARARAAIASSRARPRTP